MCNKFRQDFRLFWVESESAYLAPVQQIWKKNIYILI